MTSTQTQRQSILNQIDTASTADLTDTLDDMETVAGYRTQDQGHKVVITADDNHSHPPSFEKHLVHNANLLEHGFVVEHIIPEIPGDDVDTHKRVAVISVARLKTDW